MTVIEIGVFLGDQKGTVRYIVNTMIIEVDFPDPEIEKRIKEYLTTKRKDWIPESDRIEDYRSPNGRRMQFELAMCELWSNTGVMVDWGTRRVVREG